MDRKTEELRDIFMDVADDDTVTESQEESRGTLTDREDADAKVRDLVSQMRERYGFASGMEGDTLLAIVERFYEGEDDQTIATALDGNLDAFEVFIARTDLHLISDDDLPGAADIETLREMRDEGVDAVAEALDVEERTARRYVHALDARERSRAANDRYRDAFDDLLTDAALSTDLDGAREDGLDEATEGMEVDVDF